MGRFARESFMAQTEQKAIWTVDSQLAIFPAFIVSSGAFFTIPRALRGFYFRYFFTIFVSWTKRRDVMKINWVCVLLLPFIVFPIWKGRVDFLMKKCPNRSHEEERTSSLQTLKNVWLFDIFAISRSKTEFRAQPFFRASEKQNDRVDDLRRPSMHYILANSFGLVWQWQSLLLLKLACLRPTCIFLSGKFFP